jgi:uncharacterized membrane protein SpoIIM required for sporulation
LFEIRQRADMKETKFIEQNKKKWAKFEKMTQSNQNDPDEMSQLFVELTDDLAYARTHYPKRSVRVYLNGLAQRIFHDLYKRRKEPLSKFFKFWTTSLPLEMYRARHIVLLSFVIFMVGMLIGIVSTIDDENFLGAVIGYDYVAMAEENIANGKPMNVYGQQDEVSSFISIAINNARVGLIVYVLGIFVGLGSAVIMFFNAIMVGAFQWFYVVRGLTLTSFLTIWIHGAFEIPTIVLEGAAGMTLGLSYVFPGTLTRGQALVIGAKRSIKMMIGLFPFIILAAFIEGYATRHTVITIEGDPIVTEWPESLKWVFILSCFALFVWYFVIYPFFVARKHNFTDKIVEKPQFREEKQVSLFKIKDVGEIFTDTFVLFRKCFGVFIKIFWITIPLNILYLYLLFEKYPYFYKDTIDDTFFGSFIEIIFFRIAKMFENLEILFVWNNFFDLTLFLFQVLVFSLNANSIIFAFKAVFQKSIPLSLKSYVQFTSINIFRLIPVYLVMGVISCFANLGLMVLLSALAPLFFMFDKPMTFGKKGFADEFGKGFSIGFKSYGNAFGLFFALLLTLVIVYIFVGVPVEFFLDRIVEWLILPMSEDPKYWLIFVDAIFYMTLAHIIFPIFHIAYSLLYFSTIEKEEGIALFKKLESFGTKNKNYESSTAINED